MNFAKKAPARVRYLIRKRYASGRYTQWELARTYGITQSYVSRILAA